jgi:hypothetical protein
VLAVGGFDKVIVVMGARRLLGAGGSHLASRELQTKQKGRSGNGISMPEWILMIQWAMKTWEDLWLRAKEGCDLAILSVSERRKRGAATPQGWQQCPHLTWSHLIRDAHFREMRLCSSGQTEVKRLTGQEESPRLSLIDL